MHPLFHHSQSGYGVGIIMAVVAILALSASLLSQVGESQLDTQSLYIETQKRIATAQNAINVFFAENGYYPCAAPNAVNNEDATFGVAGACTAATTNIDRYVSSSAGTSLQAGVLPVRSLGLSDDAGLDGYGNRFTYIVVEDIAQSSAAYNAFTSPDTTNKLIRIEDAATTGTLHADISASANGMVAYAIISHGANGHGAYSAAGAASAGCSPTVRPLEEENCDTNFLLYASKPITVDTTAATHFDDIVSWKMIK